MHLTRLNSYEKLSKAYYQKSIICAVCMVPLISALHRHKANERAHKNRLPIFPSTKTKKYRVTSSLSLNSHVIHLVFHTFRLTLRIPSKRAQVVDSAYSHTNKPWKIETEFTGKNAIKQIRKKLSSTFMCKLASSGKCKLTKYKSSNWFEVVRLQ